MKKKKNCKNKVSTRKSFYALLILASIFMAITVFTDTFSVFQTDGLAVINQEVGKWVIKINDIDISTSASSDFVIDNFNYSANTKVKDGKIAPGRSGYFDVTIDPTGTEVSVLYSIEFDFGDSEMLTSSVVVLDGDGVVKTGPNKFSGIISLDDIENEITNTLRVYIEWTNDETRNEEDTDIGMNDQYISIPVSVNAVQYQGEVLVPYSE